MATDYYQMGKDLGSAYGDGVEVRRQRDRQIETDAWAKKQYEDQQLQFANQQTVFNQGQQQYNDTTAALGGDAPAGLPTPAGPIGSRDVPPQSGGLAEPAGPIGSRGAPQAAGLPAGTAAPAKFDAHLSTLEQALKLARATRDVAGVNKANASIAQHKINLEDGDAVTGLMSAPAEKLQALYGHINTYSKSLMAIGDTDAKGKPTGYTRLLMVAPGGAASEMKLSKAQLGRVLIAQRKLDRGDMTGLDDMDAVSGKLAAAVASEMGMYKDMATTNNKVQHDKVTGAAATTSAGAAATNAGAHARVAAAQIGEIDANRAATTEAKKLQGAFSDLTPEEQNGPKGLALQKQYNMAVAKPGAQLQAANPRSDGARKSVLQMPVEQKPNDDGSYTAFSKDGGQPLYNTYHGETLPMGMTVKDFTQYKMDAAKARVQMRLGEDDDGKLWYKFVGPSGEDLPTVDEAARSKAPKAAPPGPSPIGVRDAPATGLPDRRAPRVPPVAPPLGADRLSWTVPGETPPGPYVRPQDKQYFARRAGLPEQGR